MEHIVAYSGGKDSSAMLLRMIELDMQIDKIVFADTTLEFPEMYKYINKIEKHIGRKITRVRPKKSFYHWFYGKFTRGKHKGRIRGFPYVVTHGYCCRELKIYPMRDLQPTKDNIVYLGIAKGEEKRIQKNPNLKYPLLDWGWTEEKCLQYLKDKGLENPLYKHFKRTGCWLCPKQSQKSLKSLYLHYPAMWKHLKKLEHDSPHGFHPDYTLVELENKWNNKKLTEYFYK